MQAFLLRARRWRRRPRIALRPGGDRGGDDRQDLQRLRGRGRQTESGHSGNGYGGVQLDAATWKAYGGDQYALSAEQASKDQQIAVAEKVRQDRGGYSAWPACSKKLGLA